MKDFFKIGFSLFARKWKGVASSPVAGSDVFKAHSPTDPVRAGSVTGAARVCHRVCRLPGESARGRVRHMRHSISSCRHEENMSMAVGMAASTLRCEKTVLEIAVAKCRRRLGARGRPQH